MKKILKFYMLMMATIAIFVLYGHVIFPLLCLSNTIANIFGWILIPLPIIGLWYIIKWLYPVFIKMINDDIASFFK